MKQLVKRVLKILGHALTVSVHERLDHTDHALDLVIDQNNRMARAQTALLQSSIHMVTSLNRLQGELTGMKRSLIRLSGRGDRLVEGLDRSLAEIAHLKAAAERQVELLRGPSKGTA